MDREDFIATSEGEPRQISPIMEQIQWEIEAGEYHQYWD